MTLSVKTDHNWPGGGFALLRGEGLDGVTAVTIENCLSKLLLDARGQWGKFPHPFPVEQPSSGALLLEPDIVDQVPTELFILLRNQTGAELGRLFWADVMPSRNPGSTTSADVLAIHRRHDVVTDASKPEPPPVPAPGIELASVTVAPPPPPPIESTMSAPPMPPPVSQEPPAIIPPPPPIPSDERRIQPVDDRPPVPPALHQTDDGRPAASVAPRLMPTWLTITLAAVFSSSLLLVVLIMTGVFERIA